MGLLIDLPFSLYQTFVLEQRFGFNKTTPTLWLQRLRSKSLCLARSIGLPIWRLLVLWMMGATGASVVAVDLGRLDGFQPVDAADLPDLDCTAVQQVQAAGRRAR